MHIGFLIFLSLFMSAPLYMSASHTLQEEAHQSAAPSSRLDRFMSYAFGLSCISLATSLCHEFGPETYTHSAIRTVAPMTAVAYLLFSSEKKQAIPPLLSLGLLDTCMYLEPWIPSISYAPACASYLLFGIALWLLPKRQSKAHQAQLSTLKKIETFTFHCAAFAATGFLLSSLLQKGPSSKDRAVKLFAAASWVIGDVVTHVHGPPELYAASGWLYCQQHAVEKILQFIGLSSRSTRIVGSLLYGGQCAPFLANLGVPWLPKPSSLKRIR